MNVLSPEEQQQQMGRIIAKCWADEAFKQKLIDSPVETLLAEGIEVPEGLEIKVVENTDSLVYVVLPQPPLGELSDSELDKMSGGLCSLEFPLNHYKQGREAGVW